MKTKIAAGFAVSALLIASACGSRPSVDELSDTLQDVGASEEEADCVAEVMYESDISDEGLQAIADQDEDYEPSQSDEEAAEAAQGDALECVAGDMEIPSPEELEEMPEMDLDETE